jgi:GNAT superfamily N-acetyltransferase
MRTEVIRGITVRPLRAGETDVIQAVFDRLGPRSRLLRFGGAKNVLLPSDLELLSRVDAEHHVLVAIVEGQAVGIARLVRHGDVGEVAFAVADAFQGVGVGTVLVDRLAEDARAAGITSFRGDVAEGNTASQALMKRLNSPMWRTQSA